MVSVQILRIPGGYQMMVPSSSGPEHLWLLLFWMLTVQGKDHELRFWVVTSLSLSFLLCEMGIVVFPLVG